VPAGREAAMRELIADGYFELYERVPGQYVSCHRLVAPAVLMTPDAITRFTGEWEFLSNFFPAMLVWEGMYFPTSEHAFNAGKTLDVAERFWIAGAPTPAEAKRRGRSVALRPGWDETVRYEVMAEVLRAKFTCRTERTKLLLSTGTAELVEGNYHHDQHWGRCNCAAHAGRGDNHLGRLLMQLREELQA
jgi:ribA/ribD-fused uncharacterized protein